MQKTFGKALRQWLTIGRSSRPAILLVWAVGMISLVQLPLAGGQGTSIVFENARPGVKYIGTQQCVSCHREQHASYLETTHSIATTRTDPKDETAPNNYQHPVLGYLYEVEEKGGGLVHREIIKDSGGQTVAETEKRIDLTVGSGAHAKSYLFRDGEFYGQSPLTWYAEANAIRMSPGFEGNAQPSFHRKIDSECAFCHVGSIDPKEHNPYQFEILETTIGCERCHGPGELHAKRYRDDPHAEGEDYTIVNPEKLSRDLAESICQQCHLQGANWVTTTGHDVWDFRPGRPITDFRVDYQFSLGSEGMRIVGHVEQMHASECYQQTRTLTCTTCHPPHQPVSADERVDFYRSVCIDCHEDESCGKPLAERMRHSGNSCFQCHMPKADTNVTHAAFHHHRIGVHTRNDISPKVRPELIPVLDISRLSERERQRCLAIAKVFQLRENPGNPDYNHFGHEATESLIRLRSTGPVDALSDSQLALLASVQNQRGIAEGLAKQALAKEPRPTLARIEATGLLAKLTFQDGNYQRAAELYRRQASYRRDALDAYMLGLCEHRIGNVEAATSALEESLEIDPLFHAAHSALQVIFQSKNQPDKAAFHAKAQSRIANFLQQLQRD